MIHLSIPAVLAISLIAFKACNGEDVSGQLAVVADKTVQASAQGSSGDVSSIAARLLSDNTARDLGMSEREIAGARNLRGFGGDIQSLTNTLNNAASTIQKYKAPAPRRSSARGSDAISKTEYTVIDLPKGSSSKMIALAMNTAGDKGWDCFHVESAENSLQLLCKRMKPGAKASVTHSRAQPSFAEQVVAVLAKNQN